MKMLRAILKRKTRAGFTVVELLTAMSIFVMVVLCLVTVQILGLKMNAISAGKLESTAGSMKSLNYLRRQVLGAFAVQVGSGSSTTFTSNGTNGDAMEIFPGTNLNNYLRFYWSADTLCELNSSNSQITVLANNITNQPVFEMVDYTGNMSSSSREHFSIRLTLQFAQLAYKVPTNKYEYFTMVTEMTPRLQSN
ncbi:MAG TPA: hypothetical protein VKV04_19090 [Verrucomicrobiae bacterium]|nr:hypothetical protein [Verrucomicrobiae bacterium]